MKIIRFLPIFLLCFLCPFRILSSQELTLFKVEHVKLEKHSYPWGNELALFIDGSAHRILNHGTLTLFLYYENCQVRWFQIPLERKPRATKIFFQKKIDPINRAVQRIPSGHYLVKLEFSLQNQEIALGDHIRKRLGNRKIKIYSKKFFIGSLEQMRRVKRKRNAFYIREIKSINALFIDIFKKRSLALRPEKKSNPFFSGGNFSYQKWRIWLNNLLDKLDRHRQVLDKYSKQCLVLMYPQTHANLKLYCDVVERVGKRYAGTIFRHYRQRENDSHAMFKDPYGLVGLRGKLRYLRQLHNEMAKEVSFSIEDELGYFPPPPIFRY